MGQAMQVKRGEYPVPEYGASGLEPRYTPDLWQPPAQHPFDYQKAPAPKPPAPPPAGPA